MRSGIQNTILKSMAEYGCYFLCICELGERITGNKVDVIDFALHCQNKGYLDFDFTVLNPGRILGMLTKKYYDVTKSKEHDDKADYRVLMYHNDKTGLTHFRLDDWDSLTDSITVKEGKIIGYRNFKEMNK